jgi:hypothetical protein
MERYDTILISSSSSEALNLPIDLGSAYRMPLLQNIVNVESFRVKDVSVPRTFYTILEGQLVFGLHGNATLDQSIIIPAGNYTASQLSAYISAQWLLLTGTQITVDFSSPQFRVIITRTAGIDATISITATQIALAGMGSIMGFFQAIPLAVSITASNMFHIFGPNKILVNSSTLDTNNNMISHSILHNGRDGQYIRSNVIFALYANGNMGDIMSSIIPGDFIQFQTPQKISSLDFSLTDEDGNAINLNGSAWTITIELRQRKNV